MNKLLISQLVTVDNPHISKLNVKEMRSQAK